MSRLWTPPKSNVNQALPRPGWEWAWQGLVFAHVGHYSPTNPRSGTLFNTADYVIDGTYGKVLDAADTGGVYYDIGPIANYSGETFSIVVLARIDSYGSNYAALLDIPYRDDNTWTDPYSSLVFQRHYNTDDGRLGLTTGGTDSYARANAGVAFFETNSTWHQYVAVNDYGSVDFYKDGAFWDGSSLTSGAIDWNDRSPIHLLERNHKITGEGMDGAVALALVYTRVLTPYEIQALYHDPFAAFQQPRSVVRIVQAEAVVVNGAADVAGSGDFAATAELGNAIGAANLGWDWGWEWTVGTFKAEAFNPLTKPDPWDWRASAVESPGTSLASGLTSLVPIWENDDTPEDVAGSTSPTAQGNAHWVDGVHGGEIDFDGAGDYLDWGTTDSPMEGLTSMSGVLVVRIDDDRVGEGNEHVSIIRHVDVFNIQVNNHAYVHAAVWPGGGPIEYVPFEIAPDEGYEKGHYVVLVWTWASADQDVDWWTYNITNGQTLSWTSTWTSTGALGPSTEPYYWGISEASDDPDLEEFDGAIVLFGIWNRKLSDSEAATLVSDPYLILQHGPEVDLAGSGSFAASATVITAVEGAADLPGDGQFAADATTVVNATADLAGAGAFTSSSDVTVNGVADLAGTGAIASSSKIVANGKADVTNRSDLLESAEVLLLADRYLGTGFWGDESGNAHHAQLGGYLVGADNPPFLPYSGTQYLYLPGNDSNAVSVPHDASFEITGDLEVVIKVTFTDMSATNLVPISDVTTSNEVGWFVKKYAADAMYFRAYYEDTPSNGIVQATWTSMSDAITEGEPIWLKFTVDVSSGTAKIYTSENGTSFTERASGTAGGTITLAPEPFDSLKIGSENTLTGNNFLGEIYRAILRDGIDGTTVLDVDFNDATEPFASFTEGTGKTVTINRASSGKVSTVVDRAAWLYGTNNLHIVDDHPDLDFGAEDSYTIMVAGRKADVAQINTTFVGKSAGAGAGSVGYLHYSHSGSVYALQVDGTYQRFDTKSGAISDNVAFVTASRRNASTNEIEVFVDGVGTGSPATDEGLTLTNNYGLTIGAINSTSPGRWLDGEIHAVVLWRYALTGAELIEAENELLGILETFEASAEVTAYATADLAGTGTLAADATVVVDGQADVAGSGAIASSSELTANAIADVAGNGAIASDATVVVDGQADIAGDGAIASSSEVLTTAVVDLAGNGAIDASADVTVYAEADVAGNGAIAADATTVVSASADIAGSGSVAADATVQNNAAADVSGSGAIASSSELVINAEVDTSGSGEGNVNGLVVAYGEADIAGSGAIASSSVTEVTGVAGLAGAGAIAADADVIAYGEADVAGSGAIASSSEVLTTAVVDVAGSGAIAADVDVTANGQADIAGTGAVVATADVVANGQADVAGAGSILALAGIDAYGVVDLAGNGAIAADADVTGNTVAGVADLSGSGDIAASGTVVPNAQADVVGSGAIASSSEVVIYAQADLAGNGAIASFSEVQVLGQADLAGNGAIASSATVVSNGATDVAGSGAVASSSVSTVYGAADVAGNGTSEAIATVAVDGAADVVGSSFITSGGTVRSNAQVDVAGDGVIASSSELTANAIADIAGAGTIAANSVGTSYGAADVAGNGAIASTSAVPVYGQFDVSGTGEGAANAYVVVKPTADLAGTGAIASSSETSAEGQADVAGSGAINATAHVTVYAASDVAGDGAIHAFAGIDSYGLVDVDGSGDIAASAHVIRNASASVDSTSAITSSSEVTVYALTDLTGVGAIQAFAGIDSYGLVDLAGSGSIEAVANVISAVEGAANVDGSGEIASTSQNRVLGSSNVTGSGAVASSSETKTTGSVNLAGTGTASSSSRTAVKASVQLLGAVSDVGTGASAKVIAYGSSALAGSGVIDPAARVAVLTGAINLDGTGTILSIASHLRIFDITGSGSFGFSAKRIIKGDPIVLIRSTHLGNIEPSGITDELTATATISNLDAETEDTDLDLGLTVTI